MATEAITTGNDQQYNENRNEDLMRIDNQMSRILKGLNDFNDDIKAFEKLLDSHSGQSNIGSSGDSIGRGNGQNHNAFTRRFTAGDHIVLNSHEPAADAFISDYMEQLPEHTIIDGMSLMEWLSKQGAMYNKHNNRDDIHNLHWVLSTYIF